MLPFSHRYCLSAGRGVDGTAQSMRGAFPNISDNCAAGSSQKHSVKTADMCQIPQAALLAQPSEFEEPSGQGHGAHVPGAGLLLPGLG